MPLLGETQYVPNPELLAYGLPALLFGFLSAYYPEKTARFEERIDAIGRKPAGPVEPAGWKVGLNRVVGAGMVIFGVLAVGSYLLG